MLPFFREQLAILTKVQSMHACSITMTVFHEIKTNHENLENKTCTEILTHTVIGNRYVTSSIFVPSPSLAVSKVRMFVANCPSLAVSKVRMFVANT